MIDTFSGIGGFSLAARWLGGIETVQFVEREPFCQRILAKHWPNVPIHKEAAKEAAGASHEIQGAVFMRANNQPFYFLPLFGFSDPEAVIAATVNPTTAKSL